MRIVVVGDAVVVISIVAIAIAIERPRLGIVRRCLSSSSRARLLFAAFRDSMIFQPRSELSFHAFQLSFRRIETIEFLDVHVFADSNIKHAMALVEHMLLRGRT
jgi:hypothetical protein